MDPIQPRDPQINPSQGAIPEGTFPSGEGQMQRLHPLLRPLGALVNRASLGNILGQRGGLEPVTRQSTHNQVTAPHHHTPIHSGSGHHSYKLNLFILHKLLASYSGLFPHDTKEGNLAILLETKLSTASLKEKLNQATKTQPTLPSKEALSQDAKPKALENPLLGDVPISQSRGAFRNAWMDFTLKNKELEKLIVRFGNGNIQQSELERLEIKQTLTSLQRLVGVLMNQAHPQAPLLKELQRFYVALQEHFSNLPASLPGSGKESSSPPTGVAGTITPLVQQEGPKLVHPHPTPQFPKEMVKEIAGGLTLLKQLDHIPVLDIKEKVASPEIKTTINTTSPLGLVVPYFARVYNEILRRSLPKKDKRDEESEHLDDQEDEHNQR